MSDGRCMTVVTSNRLLNERLMQSNGLGSFDNFNYRQTLQRMGPDIIQQATVQDAGCNMPLFGQTGTTDLTGLEGYSKDY